MSDTNITKYSAEEWEHLRKRFKNSAMIDTEVVKLGQAAGTSWPFKGSGETPAKYFAYDFEELNSVPGLVGKKSRVKRLMDIFREILAFDDPFGDMADTIEIGGEEDSTFNDILNKVGVSGEYPTEFLHFSNDTQELLKNEGVNTLIECVHFGQNLANSDMIGGELRSFLNSLAHKDEKVMAEHMPYRSGGKGLHLAEAIGLTCENLDAVTKLYLAKRGGVSLSDKEEQKISQSSDETIEQNVELALKRLSKLIDWFSSEASDLKQAFATDGAPERFFICLNDPYRERMAVELAKLHYVPDIEKKSGLLGRMFGR